MMFARGADVLSMCTVCLRSVVNSPDPSYQLNGGFDCAYMYA
jgi:hypothetical protein